MNRTTIFKLGLMLLAGILCSPADGTAQLQSNIWEFVEICELPLESNAATSSGVAVADLDRNGQQDIIAVETLTGNPPNWIATAYAFYNTANCQFSTSFLLPPAGAYGYSAYIAELNNDGWPDAIFGSHGAKRVFLNDGQGRLVEAWSEPIGGGWGGIDLADVNGDGFRDFVSGAQTGSGALLSVFQNDGTGLFAPVWASDRYGNDFAVFHHTLVANLNDDPYPDIVATVWQGPEELKTFLGDGTGSFVPHETLGGSRFFGLAVGNVNGDRRDDVAMHDSGGPLRVLIADMDGRLTTYWESGDEFSANFDVTLADFDADGFDDLFAREYRSGQMRIYRNVRGAERFQLVWVRTGEPEGVPGTIADFDLDGFPDVLVRDAHRIRVLRNMNAVSGDADGDGVPNDQDQCPNTAAGAIVDGHGCSIDQLVPCAGPATGGTWKNHGHFVSAVVRAAQGFQAEGRLSTAQRVAIVEAAAQSDCGKK